MTKPATTSSTHVKIGIRGLQLYQLIDTASGLILMLMLAATPWLFGTTQPETIRGMNLAGGVVTLLLLSKWALRRATGYRPARWESTGDGRRSRTILALGVLTLVILGYMLVSLMNTRAEWDPATQTLFYHDHFNPWLPHTFERNSTRNLLLNYSAMAGFFWALWDWLNGLTAAEQRARSRPAERTNDTRPLPGRLTTLLWVLSLNGACLAIEGIVQRQTNTDKLLWLVQPTVFKSAEAHFGPYAYRANGAQYLNLIWPVALGFWWTLNRAATKRRWAHHLLLPAIAVMAASPFIATTRAGAIISGLLMIASLLFLAGTAWLLPDREPSPWSKQLATGLAVLAVFGGGLWMAQRWGGTALERRMIELDSGLAGRENLNAVGRKIAADFRWWGSGPGTLVAIYPLYRDDTEDYWPAQLHNDWLETRITFGRIGTALILSALALVLGRWWRPGGIPSSRRLVGLIWIALGGILLHARFDFPFQIYSLLLTTLAIGAVLFSLGARRT